MVATAPDVHRSLTSKAKPGLRQSLWSIAVLAAAGLAIALVSIGVLYKVSVHQQGLRLLGTVREQARIIEAMAAHEMQRPTGDASPAGDSAEFEAALGQLRAAQDKLAGLGQTGELYVARREGDSIVYLLAHRGQSLIHPARVVFGRERGEPMYRALTGRSGAGVLHDYRGTPVLAAYEPVKVFGLGMVAAIDVSEVRAPFLRADLIVLAATLLFVIGGGLLLLFVTAPGRRRLQESEEFTRRILAASPDSIKVLDLEGRLLYINEGGRRLLEIDDLSTVLNTSWTDLWQGKDREAALEAIAAAKAGGTGTFDGYRPSSKGTPKFWNVVVTALVGPDGKAERLLAASRDITERKRAEAELAKYRDHLEELVSARTRELAATQERLVLQEKLATVGRVAGSVAHELRNPLGAIRNASCFLQMTVAPKLEGKPLQHLRIIDVCVERANKAITMILDFTQGRTTEPVPCALHSILQQAVAEASLPDSIEVCIAIPPGLPQTLVDKGQVVVVFRNLLTNAARAMPGGGTVKIQARAGQDEVVVDVTDTGTGIKAEHMASLFQPLFTTWEIGVGLGLAICRGFIEANKGTISVVSELGKGTTFTVTLPAMDEDKS